MKRRDFLSQGVSGLAIAASTGLARGGETKTEKPPDSVNTSHELPARLGTYYQATVPDTLDLAERARLGLQYFDSIMEASLNYEMFFGEHFDTHPVSMYAHVTSLGACQEKALEAIAFQRLMTGSTLNLDREAKMVDMLASMLGDDGLQWVKEDVSKKPWMKIGEPFVMVHGQGRMMRAMIAWHQYTGDPAWAKRIDRMVDGMDRKLVVHKGDYAYIPVYGYYPEEYLRSCYTPRGWKDTVEPTNEKFGEEGSLFNHQGHIPGALANWYVLTGNEQALRLAGELVRFYTKPQFWADWRSGEYPIVAGAQHAHWHGHWHGYLNTLRAIFEYAIAAQDDKLMGFVRDGYDWARQKGCARFGYFDGQGCGCGRIIGLAVKLSYHGVGDYWEDVDQYIRNQGTVMQIQPQDHDYLAALSAHGTAPKTGPEIFIDTPASRFIGGYGGEVDKNGAYLCCGAHGNMGLFYAWDGTVRNEGGTTRVNLLLNRASPWLDMDSYLPYEGKVVLRNKGSQEIYVRMPLWVDQKAVRCSVGEREITPPWFYNQLRFRSLHPHDVLTLEFPVEVKTEAWTISRVPEKTGTELHDYTCKFKANTLVEISPPLRPGSNLYNRDYFLNAQAPMTKVTRFVTPKVFKW